MKTSSNTKPDSVPTPLHRDVKRTVLKITGVTLLAFAAGVYYLRSDIAPPDVAALEAQPVLNVASDDFFDVNDELYAKLPKEDWKRNWDLSAKGADKEAIEKGLARGEQAGVLASFEKAVHADRGPTRWGKIEATISVLPYMDTGRFVGAHAEDVARHGDPDRALNEATKVTAYGRNMAHASSDLLTFLGAEAVQSIGLQSLRRLTKEYTFSEQATRQAIADLERNRISKQIFSDTVRGEFALINGIIKTNSMSQYEFNRQIKTSGFFYKTTFKKNETTKELADYYGAMLALPFDQNWKNEASAIGERGREDAKRISLSNFAGKRFLSTCLTDPGSVYGRHLAGNSFISAAQAALAVRLYQAKHNGALPETLDELVREGILSSVPLDYIDEQPIRYSKELRIVWTIGRKGWNPPFPDLAHEDFDEVEEGIFRL
jgi:hypothetical protein